MQIPGFWYKQLTFINKQRDNTTSSEKKTVEMRIFVVCSDSRERKKAKSKKASVFYMIQVATLRLFSYLSL